MTYEEILQRMLDKITDAVDKREGSLIYNALAPAAFELAQMHVELEGWLQSAFAHTSSGEYLEKRCAEVGIERKLATKAIKKGVFNIPIPIASRFSIDDLIYSVIENISGNEYKLECEVPGITGNLKSGTLLPIDYIEGLQTASLSDLLVPGEDKETDEQLLARFDTRVQRSATSGNKNHYTEWANEVNGVGAVRVIPLWNGNNTVKIIVVGADMAIASTELINEVQDYIDPLSEGMGKGKAPIGAICTATSGTPLPISINADISASSELVLPLFQSKLTSYFEELITTKWQNGENYTVSHARIGALLLESITDTGGVDYSNLTVNGNVINISLTDDFPSIGTVTLNEVT